MVSADISPIGVGSKSGDFRGDHVAERCSYTRAMDFEDIKAAFWNETVAFEVQAPLTDAMSLAPERRLA